MGRILLLVLTLMVIAPPAAEAQRTLEVRRIGYLQADVSGLGAFYDILRQGLRDLGYEEGRGIGLLGFLGRPASESGILCRD